MEEIGRPVWFLGDLDDPWVARIADSIRGLPGLAIRSVVGDLPSADRMADPPSLLIVHRSRLSDADIASIESWVPPDPDDRTELAPGIVLCYGPLVRYAELERCARLSCLLIPEAVAAETLDGQARRRLGMDPRGSGRVGTRGLTVDVVSSNRALRDALAEGLEGLGIRSRSQPDPGLHEVILTQASGRADVMVWDVPVLEPGWTAVLERRARQSAVIALLGIADRALVTEAKAAGAYACLDVPLDLEDLASVIGRIHAERAGLRTAAVARAEPRHAVPPGPSGRSRWSVDQPATTIPERSSSD
ncbi:hypothetical protein [Aquisphaera insulae]|uniref:hypothetical protein n=1 Tax=Aquisphaera insulae TaxID=2712864 RepID=UPI0013ED4510|nr:hypothetical protein [Aquisphaera insulae]